MRHFIPIKYWIQTFTIFKYISIIDKKDKKRFDNQMLAIFKREYIFGTTVRTVLNFDQ